MALTKLTESLNIISELADKPTQTANQLKAKFDEASGLIKEYINEILTEEIDELLENTVQDDDSRLTDSRQCNDSFNDAETARDNLELKTGAVTKISSGPTVPVSLENGEIYIQYFE